MRTSNFDNIYNADGVDVQHLVPAVSMTVLVVKVHSGQGDVDSRQELMDGGESNVTEEGSDVHDGGWEGGPAELVVSVAVTVSDLFMTSVMSVASVTVRFPSTVSVVMMRVGRGRPETGSHNSWGYLRQSAGTDGGDSGSSLNGFRTSETFDREDSARG